MGNETILYYVFEEAITGYKRNVKKHFWQKITPLSFVVEEDELSIVTVMIPMLDKGWKREKLIKFMQEGIKEYPDYVGNAEVIIHSDLKQILMQEESFSPVFWDLADILLNDNFYVKKRISDKLSLKDDVKGSMLRVPESVVLLLGNSFFPEEQIERFTEMLHPYFSYVNQLTIVYEQDDEKADITYVEAVDDLLEMLYYEYGLVARIWNEDGYKPQPPDIKNGRYSTLFLDYGYQGKLPYSMMRNGGTYIDVLSSEEKKRRINKKCSKISYLSPRKYLDTMVKSGYDKLVNRA